MLLLVPSSPLAPVHTAASRLSSCHCAAPMNPEPCAQSKVAGGLAPRQGRCTLYAQHERSPVALLRSPVRPEYMHRLSPFATNSTPKRRETQCAPGGLNSSSHVGVHTVYEEHVRNLLLSTVHCLSHLFSGWTGSSRAGVVASAGMKGLDVGLRVCRDAAPHD